MARIIRRVVGNRKRGAALIAALQVIALILIGFLSFIGGPQHSANKAPADTQVSGPAEAQTGDPAQAPEANNNNNNVSPPASGLLPRERASNSGFTLMEAPGSNGATVTTDKPDYVPGDTVVISGTGWTPNEAVALHIDDSNGVPRFDASVMADVSGNISNSDFVIQPEDVGLAFTLTATQGAVMAWTQFTDVVGAGYAPNGDPGDFEIQGNVVATAGGGHTDWVANGAGTTGLLNPAVTPAP